MIHVGTCSWPDKDLMKSGEFFPGDVKTAEARLRFYTSHFQAVEVDSSYYAYRRDSILQVSWENRENWQKKGSKHRSSMPNERIS